jgi:phosphoglycerate dehydrogenase-like enzyme
MMKPTARISYARGGLIDEAALCEAIKGKKIAGAALDAYSEEPLPLASPLRLPESRSARHMAATSIETLSICRGSLRE